jgi:hypothetical protein
MTHYGDPHNRVWGGDGCRSDLRERNYKFGAVIGVGGCGPEPVKNGLYNKVIWIGIGPIIIGDKIDSGRCKSRTNGFEISINVRFRFHRFRAPGNREIYQMDKKFRNLAGVMYENPSHRRAPFFHDPGSWPDLDYEIEQLLQTAA